MSLSPGRSHDLSILNGMLQSETDIYKRQRIKNRIQIILKESERPQVANMRQQIINAYKRRDTAGAEAIGEALWQRTRK